MFEIELSVASFCKQPPVGGVARTVLETIAASADTETLTEALAGVTGD